MFILKKHNKFLMLYLVVSSHLLIVSSHANTFGDIDVGIFSDDNLTRSDYGPDKKAGTAVDIFADYGKFYELKDNWSATATVFSQYTNQLDFSKLSTLSIGASGSAGKKLGLGAYSSSIQASASISINTVNDSNRSNNRIDIGMSWDKRLSDVWELAAGVSLDSTSAKNSVFNGSGTTLFVSADYTFTEKLLFSFGVSRRSGDIITVTNASTNPNEATYSYLSLSSGGNNISDDVFGSGLTAYRIKADTLIFKVAASYALNDSSSINAGYENQNSSLAYGISYKNNLMRINYVYSF